MNKVNCENVDKALRWLECNFDGNDLWENAKNYFSCDDIVDFINAFIENNGIDESDCNF